MFACRFYIRRLSEYRVARAYMKHQINITVASRSVLVNWLMTIIHDFSSLGYETFQILQTLHRSVAYFDRYCGAVQYTILYDEQKVIGMACVLLAVQMKEPEACDDDLFGFMCGITNNRVSVQMMKDKTKEVFNLLSACESSNEYHTVKVSSFINFNIAGCYVYGGDIAREEKCKELWPLLAISRKDDDAFVVTLMKMLHLIDRDNQNNYMYYLTFYLGELWLQSEFSLEYDGASAAVAAFCFAVHGMKWCSMQIWKGIVKKTVRRSRLDNNIVYAAIKDLRRLFLSSQATVQRCNRSNTPLPLLVRRGCDAKHLRVGLINIKVLPPVWWF